MTTILLAVSFLLASFTVSHAEEQKPPSVPDIFSVRFEDSAFGGANDNYTNGTSVALTQSRKGLLGWIWDIGGATAGERYATYELTQLMFTPTDRTRSIPDPSDRPYAGLLYLGFTTHLQRDESLHSLKLMAGVAGPFALAEESQTLVHELLNFNIPQGWSHQLGNEPVVNLLYEYRHRLHLLPPSMPVSLDFVPMVGGFLGNYLIQGQAGGQCRLGYHSNDFGTTVLRGVGFLPFPQEDHRAYEWGGYLFAGVTGNIVGRNLTLDGSTFARSPSVDRRIFLPIAEFGASVWTRGFQTTFSYVMWGREFHGQRKPEDYGSVLLNIFF